MHPGTPYMMDYTETHSRPISIGSIYEAYLGICFGLPHLTAILKFYIEHRIISVVNPKISRCMHDWLKRGW